MATLVMRSKDERTRNAALLRYTCGHDRRYTLVYFHLIVMNHHIVISSKLVFRIVVYH